ncbi:cohesin domain-containing protein [Natrinema versiforme]|uniref:Cellulosome anchoring protein cohesin region n=1 Tax=Natrinema versiforme JCM 10478 TaxID=1227496 RepID=L9YAB4_9EURY|nr:cohesin domain-containing protein [Natrinema versiforme]ELY70994.1 cellulosome anchoring protein cohesin region [Natrinema versiforme JCM 10478]
MSRTDDLPDGDHRVDGLGPDSDRVVACLLAVVLALSLAIPVVAGTAAAIDQVAILSPEQTQVEAAPGETLEIDVALRSQGGHGGEGVPAVELVAQYHPDHLAVTDIERGPWLEGGETEINTTEMVAREQGTTILEQRREPAAGGTTGRGTIATLTVSVAEDAEAGTTPISFGESTVELTGDYPSAVMDEPVTVAIDGGNESLEAFDHPDPDEIDREAAASSEDGTADTDGDEPVSGFTLEIALLAVVLAVARFAAGRDGRRS